MIRMNQEYKTRTGKPVRIYAIDGDGIAIRVHGAIYNNGGWQLSAWAADGRYFNASSRSAANPQPNDLVEKRPSRWVVIFKYDRVSNGPFYFSGTYTTREAIDEVLARTPTSGSTVVSIVEVEDGTGMPEPTDREPGDEA